MAKVKASALDVWIIASNTVYQTVPFNIVVDWVVQGRLLGDDCVRPVGSTEWFKVTRVRQLAVYLHAPESARPEDEAEALEPVAFEVPYKRPKAEEDDDVDMIPLIDVSLVLLIFFMMLLAGSGPAMTVPLPRTEHGVAAKDETAFQVLIDYRNEEPRFGLMQGKKTIVKDLDDPDEIVREVKNLMTLSATKVNLYINAHKELPSGHVRDMIARLNTVSEIRDKLDKLYTATSDR